MHLCRRIGQGPSQNLPAIPSPLHPSNTHTLLHTHVRAKPWPCPCLLAASLHTASILPGHGLRGAGFSVCAFMCVFKSVLVHTVYRVCWKASVYVCLCYTLHQSLQLCVFESDYAVSVCVCVCADGTDCRWV